jgi:MOSC domain-containing protein YiiM
MSIVQSINVGEPHRIGTKQGVTGIDKRPVPGPVHVSAPSTEGGSGVAGDLICDVENHGGEDQAVYAYAREDLDWWQQELGLDTGLSSGMFGENLTTAGLDVTGALIGETWRVGDDVLLQVTVPRIPCSTFRAWIGVKGWLKLFTRRAAPGAYLRVLSPGDIRMGDPIAVESRPSHEVTINTVFRALTLEPDLLPTLLAASDYLIPDVIRRVHERDVFVI